MQTSQNRVRVFVVIPVAAFLFLLVTQGANIIRQATARIEQGALQSLLDSPLVQQTRGWLEQTLPPGMMEDFNLADRLRRLAESAANWLVDSGVSIFGGLFNIVSDFFILLFLLFFLVRDGRKMAEGLRGLLPLHERQTDRLYGKVTDVTNAVVFGTLAIAGLQGLLGGVGFWIVGLPGLVWGPLIIAIAIVFAEIYRDEFSSVGSESRSKRWMRTHGTKGFGSRGRRAARRNVKG